MALELNWLKIESRTRTQIRTYTVAQAIPPGDPLSDLAIEVTWLIGIPVLVCAKVVFI